MMVKPKLHLVEEMETHPIDKTVSPWLIFGSEENGRGKDALEALHDAAVMAAILGEAEEIKHLGSTVKVDGAGPLLYRQGGNPNGDQAILPKGQTESGVPGDIKGEFPIASAVSELVSRWAAKRNATENERSGVVGKFLVAVLSILADQADGLQLFELELREAKGGQYGLKPKRRHLPGRDEPCTRVFPPLPRAVRKLCQKSM